MVDKCGGEGGVRQPNNNNSNNNNGDNGDFFTVPRGGPLYISNMEGPLTSVPLFQSSILRELQNLEYELSPDALSEVPEEDISVDELKIFTEEELVEMAMKEAFRDNEDAENPSPSSEDPSKCNKRRKDEHVMSNNKDPCLDASEVEKYDSAQPDCNITLKTKKTRKRQRRMTRKHVDEEGEDVKNPSPPLEETSILKEGRLDDHRIENDKDACLEITSGRNEDPAQPDCSITLQKDKSSKRKRRVAHNHTAEETYITKVDELAKIKKRQDDDKATVRLHSFNPSCKTNNSIALSSDATEKMKPLRSFNAPAKVKLSNLQEHVLIRSPEVALSIEVYHNAKKWLKTQECLVLGRQTLTELRDKIYCLTDQAMQKAGQYDPSGYFLIEDIFCNDLRDPSAMDYSEPIFYWIQNNKDEVLKKWESIVTGELQQKQKAVLGSVMGAKLPNFKAVDMQKMRFCDVKFRLGAGYLYCHQGDCKHTIVIRDMRLVHPEDIQNQAAYPISLYQFKQRPRKCHVCRIYRATKVTVDDKWAGENPCYFCDNCYYLLHYKEGSLLYSDFSVYDYLHD